MIDCYNGSEKLQVSRDQIIYLESDDDDVYIQTGMRRYKLRLRLYEFEEQCRDQGFVRINKSNIVNIQKVKLIYPLFNSKLKLVLSNNECLYVNRTYRKAFKRFLADGGDQDDH